MRIAMAEATRVSNPDLYFWLNDDTVLDPDSLTVMTEALNALTSTPAIVVGATRSSRGASRTYGGLLAQRRLGAPVFLPCSVSDAPATCDSLNGNAVLIPRAASETLGPIPEAFSHALADLDYGLRATQSGIPIVQAPGTVGVCDYGDASPPTSGSTALRDLFGPKGLPPHAWFTYVRRHCGRRWPIHFIAPYLKAATRIRI
jgi:GT2 family glycosyltransferase